MESDYKSRIDPLSPVAIKQDQSELHAPNHETWRVVTCRECGERFAVGPHRIYGARISEEAAVKQFEAILANDHRVNRPHENGYELSD